MQAIALRVWIVAEMLALFVAGQALLGVLVYQRHIPLVMILPFVFAGFFALLLRRSRIGPGATTCAAAIPAQRLCHTWPVLSSAAVRSRFFAYGRYPQYFLAFPRYNTPLWLLVMTFYPLISVTTQELIYRVLFFDRYAPAIESRLACHPG